MRSMTIKIIKQSDCHIIKHQEAILDAKAFADGYSLLEDIVLRRNYRNVIYDMTSIRHCALSNIDFVQMKGAMFHIFMNAPDNFNFAIVSDNKEINQNISDCHSEIEEAGYQHNGFIASSLGDALNKFRCI